MKKRMSGKTQLPQPARGIEKEKEEIKRIEKEKEKGSREQGKEV